MCIVTNLGIVTEPNRRRNILCESALASAYCRNSGPSAGTCKWPSVSSFTSLIFGFWSDNAVSVSDSRKYFSPQVRTHAYATSFIACVADSLCWRALTTAIGIRNVKNVDHCFQQTLWQIMRQQHFSKGASAEKCNFHRASATRATV